MKHERMTFSVCSAAVLLASVIGFACVMCLAEAFRLQCDPQYLIAACCAVAGVAVLTMAVKHGWIIGMIAAIGYVAVLIWQADGAIHGFQTLLYQVSYEYSRCFANVIIKGEPGFDTTWFLMAVAALLTWLVVWAVCREGHAAIVALACAPVLILCLLVVDLAPVFWLVLLTAALLLLVMTGYVRAHSAHEGSRLIWWLILPVVGVFAVLLTLSPVENYVRSDWSSNLQQMAEGKFDFSRWQNKVTSAVSARWNGDLKKVELGSLGPQAKTGAYALQYRSSAPIRYLRGSSLARYEDNAWSKAELKTSLTVEQTQLIRPASDYETVLVETNVGEPLFYTAYAPISVPENGTAVDDAYLKNPDQVRGYAVRFASDHAPVISPEYEAYVREEYLQLPAEIESGLTQYLQDHGLIGAAPAAIADAVRSSGVYELNTPAVPRDEDFALYFLNVSNQGYCVHFATATVLLLRSADIPARYVTGYAVEPTVDTWVEVTQDDAHAWVEFYVDGLGWQVLDPTPAAYREESVEQTPPAQDDPPEEKPPEEPPSVSDEREEPDPTAVSITEETAETSPRLLWLILPILLAGVLLRRFAIAYCRRVQAERGHPNSRTLSQFRHMVRLYRALHEAVPEQWICLAEKAKFSQHKISEEELASLSAQIGLLVTELKKAPFFHRLWHRFGPILY